MTRLEQKRLKLEEEKKLIKSLQHREITSEEKSEFRKTSIWKNFRKKKFEEQKVDPITLGKLSKTANLHHMNLDMLFYTDLENQKFYLLNMETHQHLHWFYSHMCKDKNFEKRFMSFINEMGEINHWKDVKDFKRKKGK